MNKILFELVIYKNLLETGEVFGALNKVFEDIEAVLTFIFGGSKISRISFLKPLTNDEHNLIIQVAEQAVS